MMESVEEFLKRGGSITQVAKDDSAYRKRKKSTKIDAQAMLDAAEGTNQYDQVVAFLESQGVEVA